MKDSMWRIRISVLWIADVVALTAAHFPHMDNMTSSQEKQN